MEVDLEIDEEVVVEVVDLEIVEEIVEMTDAEEMIDAEEEEEVVVPALIAIEQGIWQEIVLMGTAGKVAEEAEEVDSEETDVVVAAAAVAGLAITATRKDIWPENAPRVTAETVEADRAISSLTRL